MDCLTALIDNSLLRREEQVGAELRFSMLPTIQEYAQEELVASGEEALVRRQHATYYLQMAEESETHLTSPRRVSWVRRMGCEQDNLQEAIAWSRSDGGDAELSLRLIGASGMVLALQRLWPIGTEHGRGDAPAGRRRAPRCARRKGPLHCRHARLHGGGPTKRPHIP